MRTRQSQFISCSHQELWTDHWKTHCESQTSSNERIRKHYDVYTRVRHCPLRPPFLVWLRKQMTRLDYLKYIFKRAKLKYIFKRAKLPNLASNRWLQIPKIQINSQYIANSLLCINEYLAINISGYLCTNSFRAVFTARRDASKRRRYGAWLNGSVREWTDDDILRYIRTYITFTMLMKHSFRTHSVTALQASTGLRAPNRL